MNRRTALVSAGLALSATAAGCLSTGGVGSTTPTEQETYERCTRVRVSYESMPDDLRHEVDVAIETGAYETEGRLLLDEAIDVDSSYVTIDAVAHEPTVSAENGTTILELREADVLRMPEPQDVRVQNDDDREHEVHVVLEGGGDEIVDEVVQLRPDEETTIETTGVFGTYELLVETTVHGEGEEFELGVGDYYFGGTVEVGPDEIYFFQSIADLPLCPWDRRSN